MRTIFPSEKRGHVQAGWLNARHSFSFGDWQNPERIHFSHLRVLNQDIIDPKSGFGLHPHRDMEILTWILSGSLAHQDSTGGKGILQVGDVQTMSAGRGIYHSEVNPSSDTPVHLLQVWILPRSRGGEPRYAQSHVPQERRQGKWAALLGEETGLSLGQDVGIFVADLSANVPLHFPLKKNRAYYVHVAIGTLTHEGVSLHAGDALELTSEEGILTLSGEGSAMLFDLDSQFL